MGREDEEEIVVRAVIGWALILGAAVAWGDAPVATRAFTVGAETTVISGPVRRDGTIDYVATINGELSKGVTAENNAFPLLVLGALPANPQWDRIDDSFRALKLPAPARDGDTSIKQFDTFADAKGETYATRDAGDAEFRYLAIHPWTAKEHPIAAEWVKASATGFGLLEQAADCSRFYAPWVQKPGTSGWPDAMPMFVPWAEIGRAMGTRAMYRAGQGDAKGAREDIGRMWRLARLTTQEGTEIDELIALALANVADQAAAGLATAPGITAAQLQDLRHDLADPKNALTLPDADMERYLALDSIMMCIRGEGAEVLDPMAIINGDKTMDTGDLAKTDWDLLMREVNRAAGEYKAIAELPTYAERQAAYAKREPAFEEAKVPLSVVAEGSSRPKISKGAVEAFLKMGPKESREAYSRRLAMLFGPDPAMGARMDKMMEREHVYRRLAELAVDLAAYRLGHREYPETLATLASPIDASDPLSGKALIYRRTSDGFLLYSVGFNGKDDGGSDDILNEKDDIVIGTGKQK